MKTGKHTKLKKILVTGGTGFIGSALVKALVKDGYKVRVLDNNFRGSLRKVKDIKGKFEFIKGDIRKLATVRKAIRGMDSVVHLAFVNGTNFFYTIPEVVLDVGVKGTMNVIDACIKEKVKDLIFASSSEVYQTPPVVPTPENIRMIIPDPLNPRYSYAGGKMIGELLTLNFGRKYFRRVVIFRPHNVYGPDMGWEHVVPQFALRMKKLALKSKNNIIEFPIQGTGKETRAFCYIDDFTSGLMKVIKKGKHLEIYHIGTDEEVTIKQVAKEVGNYYGKKVKIIPGKLQKGGTPRRCPDISKLKKLGYKSKISLKKGINLTVKWYDQNSHLAPTE